MKRVIGIDPGFASTGVVSAMFNGLEISDFAFKVIETKKAPSKLTYASQDNAARARYITRELKLVFEHARPDMICVEAMSFPRSSSAAAKMAICWGIICALSESYKVPIVQASPQVIKKEITGSISASKDEVEIGVRKLVGTDRINDALKLANVKKSKREHVIDALAACIVLSEQPGIWTRGSR